MTRCRSGNHLGSYGADSSVIAASYPLDEPYYSQGTSTVTDTGTSEEDCKLTADGSLCSSLDIHAPHSKIYNPYRNAIGLTPWISYSTPEE